MKLKRTLCMLAAALALLALGGCAKKLATIRPGDVYLSIERLSDGARVGMPNDADLAERAQALVLQLETQYERKAACAQSDGHVYSVELVRVGDGKTETELYINSDGSVCQAGKRYLPSEGASDPVALADWDDYFERSLAAAD